MGYPKIEKILKLDNLKITIKFIDGTIKEVDLSPLLANEVFEPLKESTFFEQARVDNGGYGIIWNEDLDISEAYLWDKGQTQDQIVG